MEENLCAATKSVDELVIASLPEEAKKLVCVEFPGENISVHTFFNIQ